jgi:hypothetical protein
MRFRVPRFVLARHSAYFRKAFLEMEEQEVLLIRDPDVTSAAVESLLFLYPLYVASHVYYYSKILKPA